jgi:serpin B
MHTTAQTREIRAAASRAGPSARAGDIRELTTGNARFAARLLEVLARSEERVALSPFSISEALAMTLAGARGETASEIAGALEFHLPPARLHDAFNTLEQALDALNGPGVTLSVANALYGQRDEEFRDAFLAQLARDYGAGIRIVDFEHATEEACTAINTWISDRTHGKITELLDRCDLDKDTRLVLVSAVYLNAKWTLPFDQRATRLAPFHAPDGTIEVPTMHQTATFGYLRGRDYEALEMLYQGDRLAFDILLPNPDKMRALIDRLADVGPIDLVQGLQPQRLRLALPKLQLRVRLKLDDALTTVGMPRAFIPFTADLSGIAREPGELYVKTIVHETYLIADEAGTEAAAATGVVVNRVSLPPAFIVDRPFVFLLRDTGTDAVLFLGIVSRP